MTARADTWRAVRVAWRAIDAGLDARRAADSIGPAWARNLAIGFALGRRAIAESDATRLVDSPGAIIPLTTESKPR
jgi:hypothetical protein